MTKSLRVAAWGGVEARTGWGALVSEVPTRLCRLPCQETSPAGSGTLATLRARQSGEGERGRGLDSVVILRVCRCWASSGDGQVQRWQTETQPSREVRARGELWPGRGGFRWTGVWPSLRLCACRDRINDVGYEGAVAIAEAVKRMPSLRKLTLRREETAVCEREHHDSSFKSV